MYKLVGVGGSARGHEFILIEGENIFGCSSEATHVINVRGVSKKHFLIRKNGESLILEDLKSRNGTFINNDLAQVKSIKEGDLVAVPNAVFKVVKVVERKVYIESRGSEAPQESAKTYLELEDKAPRDFISRMGYTFEHRFMPIIYSLNKTHDWKTLFVFFTVSFVLLNLLLTIGSILNDSNSLVLKEIVLRGEQYVDEVARHNALKLSQLDIDQVDASYLDKIPDISEYYIFDLKGRIIRPVENLNSFINSSFAIDAKDWLLRKKENMHRVYFKKLHDNSIGVAKAIKAYKIERQTEEVVGFITIVFNPVSLREIASNSRVAYLETLIISSILAFLFFYILYYLTIHQIKTLNFQIDQALIGKRHEISKEEKFPEMKPLENSINNLLVRMRDLGEHDEDFGSIEDDQSYLSSLREILKGSPGPGMVLNSEKNIQALNPECEDLLGLRESMASGASMIDVLRDQGLAAIIINLCDQTGSEEGHHCSEEYEISGVEHSISAVALIGKDHFPKGYLISFAKNI
ncbi:MAG: FHA domain-containing protein [Halobacteriovoraceae bacterium]|nr:FHA domain-containing protein [Halobacteriovoraceae bacterium]